MFILDTDHISLFQRRHPHVTARVLAPLLWNWPQRSSPWRNNYEAVWIGCVGRAVMQRWSEPIGVCSPPSSIFVLSRLWTLMSKRRRFFNAYALRHAYWHVGSSNCGHALSREATLVTRNRQDFAGILHSISRIGPYRGRGHRPLSESLKSPCDDKWQTLSPSSLCKPFRFTQPTDIIMPDASSDEFFDPLACCVTASRTWPRLTDSEQFDTLFVGPHEVTDAEEFSQ